MAGTDCSATASHNAQRPGIPTSKIRVSLLLAGLILGWACKAGGSAFGFDIHHRFSDPVRAIFPTGDNQHLPVKGTVDYFAAMAARDRIHGRRLAGGNTSTTPLTFVAGNTTHRIQDYGFLYYANVSIGTPGMDFLVALDTGSDLFWLPCDCVSCYKSGPGEMTFNHYGLSSSSTGKKVACSSPMCDRSIPCSTIPEQCPYKIQYISGDTSSGYLVEDVMHLTTDSNPSHRVDSNITFGCGKSQTGDFLNGGAPNGLFGLGVERISVPSILATQNITANSFSMCFGPGKVGRISFGDKGSSHQAETPFVLQQYQTYFVAITQVAVGKNESNVRAAAVFDIGTSFTYFSDPIYTFISDGFNSQVQDKRFPINSNSNIPFEFCYKMSSCSSDITIPTIHLTMGGGASYNVTLPVEVFQSGQTCIYCLGLIKDDSVSINIIGENFMYGYRMVFDREKRVLGWEESDCNYEFKLTGYPPTAPPTGTGTPVQPEAPRNSKARQLITQLEHWTLPLLLLAIL